MGLHLLWADDDPAEHDMMRKALETCAGGVALAACRTGREAVALATGKLGVCAPLDLALVDLWMPEMDGFDVLSELKKDPSTRLLPVIVYSAHAEAAEVRRAYELGAMCHVIKPPDFDGTCEFLGLLDRLWAGYITPPRPA